MRYLFSSIQRNAKSTITLSMFSSWAILRAVACSFSCAFFILSSTYSLIGSPKRGSFLTLKFLERNRLKERKKLKSIDNRCFRLETKTKTRWLSYMGAAVQHCHHKLPNLFHGPKKHSYLSVNKTSKFHEFLLFVLDTFIFTMEQLLNSWPKWRTFLSEKKF